MRTNYVLIDFESIRPELHSFLDRDHFKTLVFVGANQNKVPFETAAALQRLGTRAEYVKISGNGPNALDFHIAFHIGRLSERSPDAFFHVISKDKGFDPLIRHLKDEKIFAARWEDVRDIPLVKAAEARTSADRATLYAERVASSSSKPRRITTLTGSIHSFFSKTLSDADVTEVVSELVRRGVVSVNGTKISYPAGAES